MSVRTIAQAGLCLALLTVTGLGLAQPAAAAPTATVTGLVFDDANSNGKPDNGEGANGLTVTFDNLSTTTDASGKFSIVLPTGQYFVSGMGGGWAVIGQGVTVPTSGLNLTLRAVKPLGNVLKASMHFTQDTYKVGDTAHIVATLTNTGSSLLRGINAECNHVGDPDELSNGGPGWGPLRASGPGVTLSPHQSLTVDITDTVPAAAAGSGQVVVACDFGYPNVDEGIRPSAEDSAKVPGEFGDLDGNVVSYPNGNNNPGVGLAGVRVVLVDPNSCPVFSKTTTTDANGHFLFKHVPAGTQYKLYLYPPAGWKVSFQDPTNARVQGNDTTHFSIEVEHGSASVPNPFTSCTTGSPTSGSAGSPGGPPLANTGSHSGSLVAAGGSAVLVGLVLMGFARRRRTH